MMKTLIGLLLLLTLASCGNSNGNIPFNGVQPPNDETTTGDEDTNTDDTDDDTGQPGPLTYTFEENIFSSLNIPGLDFADMSITNNGHTAAFKVNGSLPQEASFLAAPSSFLTALGGDHPLDFTQNKKAFECSFSLPTIIDNTGHSSGEQFMINCGLMVSISEVENLKIVWYELQVYPSKVIKRLWVNASYFTNGVPDDQPILTQNISLADWNSNPVGRVTFILNADESKIEVYEDGNLITPTNSNANAYTPSSAILLVSGREKTNVGSGYESKDVSATIHTKFSEFSHFLKNKGTTEGILDIFGDEIE